ncbi:MAG: AAA family ATPase [Candidatus Melainabacteria bacterium]
MILIGGPNGAGKTTAAMAVLPDALQMLEFLNADEIAKGLSPLNPTSVRIQASKIMLERAHGFIRKKVSFGFESTLAAGTTPEKLIASAKTQGFLVVLLYFWLSSPQLALQRVRHRVASGGHDIPEEDVLRRYERSVHNLTKKYIPLADTWMAFDNSNERPYLVAYGEQSMPMPRVYSESVWSQITGGTSP